MDPIVVRKMYDIDIKKIVDNHKTLEFRNMKVVHAEYPELIVSMLHPKSKKVYTFRFLCDDIPISMSVINPETKAIAPFNEWPQGSPFLQGHSVTGHPFLCMPGIREYHTYTGHCNETHWNYSTDMFRLPSVLETVYVKMINTNS